MTINKQVIGGYAYPVMDIIPSGMGGIIDLKDKEMSRGMTIWDYFAAHALTVLQAHNRADCRAEAAGELADEMIKQRNRRNI